MIWWYLFLILFAGRNNDFIESLEQISQSYLPLVYNFRTTLIDWFSPLVSKY